jgi:mycothiol synthase
MLTAASDSDLPAAVELLAKVSPDDLFSVAGMRHRAAVRPEWARPLRLKWEEGGRLVAWATCGLDHESGDRGLGVASLCVDPGHRRRGIGTALLDRATSHLREIGAQRLSVFGQDEAAARAFAAQHGLEVKAQLRISALDPRTLPPAPEPPPGVELRPFASFADPGPLHRIDQAVSRDIPNEESIDGLDLDAWRRQFWDDPEVDRELSLAAVVGGEPVALTMVRSEPGGTRGENDITGTLPEHRGKGLATLLKHHSLQRAAARGIHIVSTGNDEDNAAMLAVNTKLGYRPSSGRLRWTRAL